MVRFLLSRPIAVTMVFLALMVFSLIGFTKLPISLLPPIDVPQIVVKVNYPNASPEAIEQNVLSRIREGLITLNGLEDIESKAGSETGTLRLQFAYGTSMELAYIEVNEKIDRLTNGLPEELSRPQVIRINTNDIPMVRIQVIPKEGTDYAEVTKLAENVLKKRIEQLQGISLVDINGKQERVITVEPKKAVLAGLGMTEQNVINAIRSGNSEPAGISVKDGQYRYFLRLATRVDTPEDIAKLPVMGPEGNIVELAKVAHVQYRMGAPMGYHLYGQREGLVITVHKQAAAKMNELMEKVSESVELFKQDYPQVDFAISQDQSNLLNAGINNLQTSLLFGGIFAFGVLFIFMGNYRMPLIIGVSLPTSLVISFLVFYAFGISINVISLSGLALGLGMLIDNAIIVLDNITRKRQEGLPLFEACVRGGNEVMSALISSVLTTLAVFVPLVFLSGISGALFFDQAVSVAAILFVSLLVAFVLLPLLYRLFFANKDWHREQEDSRFFKGVLALYKSGYKRLMAQRRLSLIILLALIPLFLMIGLVLPKEGLPPIGKKDVLLELDWNEPIGVEQNRDRVKHIMATLGNNFEHAEADLGFRQFLLFDGENAVQQASIYIDFKDQSSKERYTNQLEKTLRSQYPQASIHLMDAPNAFDQLFASNMPYYEMRWKELKHKQPVEAATMEPWLQELPVKKWKKGPGLQEEAAVVFRLDLEKLALYQIDITELRAQIEKRFGPYTIDEIKQFSEVTPINLLESNEDYSKILSNNDVRSKDGQSYALANFIQVSYEDHYKYVTADKTGIYQSVEITEDHPETMERELRNWGLERDLSVSFSGQYFKDRENLQQLMGILLVAVLLLYFILAAQFESFVQPLIVIFTLPLGIGGALLVLWLTGTSLNVMSAIGLVVMLGIMVNDAILKIDTINRLRVKYAEKEGHLSSVEILEKALYEAGAIRLKPILMTSITTILALLPVVFSAGLGADLQRPLVFSVIGGLTIGTLTALYFVPLCYWAFCRKKNKEERRKVGVAIS
ncbi:efflux RND transporter permease subunit [Echinicola marina]|uniref:efflux RND transporter permease subunit n=1 Tax=Echinicola marina TaxID=2859768 RepID=UPI001CF663AC|nr:efflux RND transporter permease subunit [Echinicola marina]UCS92435.1 efflux RND transporter permease subunit [Echinicola marina]